jgi:hypothetical protein
MVALDVFEQMNSEPFELIGANAGRYRLPGLVQIGCSTRHLALLIARPRRSRLKLRGKEIWVARKEIAQVLTLARKAANADAS